MHQPLSAVFVFAFGLFPVFCELGYAGMVREPTDRIIDLNEYSNELPEDIELLLQKSFEVLSKEGFAFQRSDLIVGGTIIKESKVFHVTERSEKRNYLPKYTRGPYGYSIPTNERLELAREYNVTLQFLEQEHFLILWNDIDTQTFCISHRWRDLIDKVSADLNFDANLDPHARTIHPVCYNIWNLNDNWEKRATMIISNLLKVVPDFVVFQEVRYNIIDEYNFKQMGKPHRFRFQSDELLKNFLELSDDQWQYHFEPAMSYLDRFHTDEGLAVFSKFPIVECSHLVLSRDLDDQEDAHQRVILRTVLDTPIGYVNVFNTHFALTEDARRRAVVELWDWIQQFPLPHILMGDLNAEPDDIAIEFLVGKREIDGKSADFVDAFTLAADAEELTFPSWDPIKRIDFILLRGFNAVNEFSLLGKTSETHSTSSREDNQLWSSDHFGVSCVISQ